MNLSISILSVDYSVQKGITCKVDLTFRLKDGQKEFRKIQNREHKINYKSMKTPDALRINKGNPLYYTRSFHIIARCPWDPKIPSTDKLLKFPLIYVLFLSRVFKSTNLALITDNVFSSPSWQRDASVGVNG